MRIFRSLETQAFWQSLHLLGTRRFGTFCFASLLATIGTWTQQVAQPWLLLSLGASSFLIGLDAFALGYAGVVVAIAADPWVRALPALLVLAGITMTVSNVSVNSLPQSTAPVHLRGKTISLYMLVMRGGVSVASLLTGISVHLLGVREALLINRVVALAAHALIGWAWLGRKP